VRLATEAAALALRMQPPPGATHATLKGAQDWLTEADGAVERLLSERLAQAYPADGFQGEEGRQGALGRSAVDRRSDRRQPRTSCAAASGSACRSGASMATCR